MNDKVQLVIVIIAVAVAVLFFVRHIYLMAKKKPKCQGCPESGGCPGCAGKHKCHDASSPPCCR